MTRSPEVDRLIALAKVQCAGCRQSFRIRRKITKGVPGDWWHSNPVRMICTAPDPRAQLREIHGGLTWIKDRKARTS